MTLLLPLALVAGQIIGGDWTTHYQFDGNGGGDHFGYVVAGAGDTNGDSFDDILVSAPYATYNGMTIAGSVYLYSGSDGSLLRQWNGSSANLWYGIACAGAGDVNGDGFADIIIGDPYNNWGQATVYSGLDGSVLHQLPTSGWWPTFGNAVAGAGDVNADGYADFAVCASSADSGGISNSGTAFIYSGLDGAVLHQFDGTGVDDYFGSQVAAAGDVNADGFDDVIFGARWTDSNGQADAGSAYVYSGADGSLLYRWDGALAGDGFGSSARGAGDIDQDGYDDLIVGGWSADSATAVDCGSAWVYSGADGSVLFKWDGNWTGDHFGFSASPAGDMNQDGFDDLVVGAAAASYSGRVYLYSGQDGAMLHEWQGKSAYDYFGWSVASAGDVDADGKPDIVAGALYTDEGGLINCGSAYVLGFRPGLAANAYSVSVANGGNIDLEIQFPAHAANYEYRTLLSASGTGPIFFGIDLPVSWDGYLVDSSSGIYPFPTHSDLHGVLGPSAEASASFGFPSGVIPGTLVGRSFWLAVAALQPGMLPEFSSVAREFVFVP